jgi:SAM-dependent MidA family methyltransferase
MTPLAEILRDAVHREGAIPFHRFMEAALYHPSLGYYRRLRDPFGRRGDYYTAEQLQPVFGILIAERIRRLRDRMGAPGEFTVVELGAGRGEMSAALGEFRYIPVELDGQLPECICGVVFSNEFFDALPVHAGILRDGEVRELRVGLEGDRFIWVEAGRAPEEVESYQKKYLPALLDGQIFEAGLDAFAWLDRIAAALKHGFVFTIDYGYSAAEIVRFPVGTLMSYRRHQALEDVLKDPGEQDISAHVCFSALQQYGRKVALETEVFEPLVRTLISAGEADQFAGALAGGSNEEDQRRRLQLKQLLVGIGESFQTLIQRSTKQKGPENSGP